MSNAETVRVIQVGVGGMGQGWLRTVTLERDDVELAAIVDVNDDILDEVREEAELGEGRAFRDFSEALTAVEADVALLVSPPAFHREQAEAALAAGLDVIMEKPLADTYEDAAAIVKAARASDGRCMVSQNYRWSGLIAAIKQAVSEGRIGTVEQVDWVFRLFAGVTGWRAKMPHVLLQDMSIHHFDLIRHLTGADIAELYARSFRPSWGAGDGRSAANVLMRLSDGTEVSYVGSWAARTPEDHFAASWPGYARLEGTDGVIEMTRDDEGDLGATVYELAGETSPHFGRGPELEASPLEPLKLAHTGLAYSFQELLDARTEGRDPVTSAEDNIKSFGAICAAIRSAEEHRLVALAELEAEAGL